MTTSETPFAIGKAVVFWRPAQQAEVAVFATGPLVYNALLAARELEKEGIHVSVINVPSIKPLDQETILRETKAAGAVVTVEEHQVTGGFGSAIAELLAKHMPTPIEFIGMQDRFGQSGEARELIEYYGMGASHIQDAIKRARGRKSI